MKNADLKKFSDLVVGERFAREDRPNEWMIKVGIREAVFIKDVIPFASSEPVYAKRGQAIDFLKEARTVILGAQSALGQVNSVLERYIGGEEIIPEKAVEPEAAGTVPEKKGNAGAMQKGWNKITPPDKKESPGNGQ